MSAQRNFPKQYTPLSINVNFGAQMPAADLATRFGNNLCLGLGVERIALPSGWILGVECIRNFFVGTVRFWAWVARPYGFWNY